MPKAVAGANSRLRGRARRIRTDGGPRLCRPGEPGHPGGPYIFIKWTERADGRSRSKRLSTEETDEARARAFLMRWTAARSAPAEILTVGEALDAYVADARARHGEKFDAKGVRQRIAKLESLLKPVRAHFGALHPSEVRLSYQRQYIAKRTASARQRGDRGGDPVAIGGAVSKRTVSLELAALRAALNRARKEGEIASAPAISLPQGSAKARRRTLKRAEFSAFMRALFTSETPDHLRAFVLLGILTGQRSKALKALRWEWVDYDEGLIRFTATDPHAADNKRIQDTPMTPDMAAFMAAWQGRAKSAFVVEWKGKGVGSVKSAWRALLARAKLTDVRVHDLRRSAATLALNAGGRLADIALLLNDSEATTSRNYAHASPGLLLDTVRLIEGQINAARDGDD